MTVDDQRLVDAAARAGILYVGCDTPSDLADEVVALRAEIAALRTAARRMLAAEKRWEELPNAYLYQMLCEARSELSALLPLDAGPAKTSEFTGTGLAPMDIPTDLLLPRDVDRLLKWPFGRAQRLARRGRLPCFVLPDGEVRFRLSDLSAFMRRIVPNPTCGGCGTACEAPFHLTTAGGFLCAACRDTLEGGRP